MTNYTSPTVLWPLAPQYTTYKRIFMGTMLLINSCYSTRSLFSPSLFFFFQMIWRISDLSKNICKFVAQWFLLLTSSVQSHIFLNNYHYLVIHKLFTVTHLKSLQSQRVVSERILVVSFLSLSLSSTDI